MTGVTLASIAAVVLLGVWIVQAVLTMEVLPMMNKWLNEPGNTLRASLWFAAVAAAIVTTLAKDGSWLAGLRSEAIAIAITVIGIDELQRQRAFQERRREILEQIGSRSNDFALEGTRLAGKYGWLSDGSLKEAYLGNANLRKAELSGADLKGIELWKADLQEASLGGANLQGAWLGEADLQMAWLLAADLRGAWLGRANLKNAFLVQADLRGTHLGYANLHGANLSRAKLEGATYRIGIIWPDGFDHVAAGAVLSKAQKGEDS